MTSNTDRFEQVVWLDAVGSAHWEEDEKLSAPIEVTSHGWLAKETESYIVLSASRYKIDDNPIVWGQTITLPKGMIVSREQLEI